jgi:2-polyprenyl-3-methyl-5-hydroxy-6-metoxy-1,4-benzoquinol methylase
MNPDDSDALHALSQLFDQAPYPNVPLDVFPKQDHDLFFIHNLITPYYLRYATITPTEGAVILDAGCGTGFKALILAAANPGARIVGIDLSEESIHLAEQRLKYHGFENVEFHTLAIEALPDLGLEFDYINCDEVLYLVPDPGRALQAMGTVLKPGGILRANLHSALQRSRLYQAQALFNLLGLTAQSPGDLEMDLVIETMQALKDTTRIKVWTWSPEWATPKHRQQILSNYLLVGDKGFTIPDMFSLLNASGLNFLSMVNWRHWDVTDLFQHPDDLPIFWNLSLADAKPIDTLRLYELLHPIHRLMDWWCVREPQTDVKFPTSGTTNWQSTKIHLHPQLRHEQMRQDLLHSIATHQPFDISRYVKLPASAPVLLESHIAACLLPLWNGDQSLESLVQRYLTITPVDPASCNPRSPSAA